MKCWIEKLWLNRNIFQIESGAGQTRATMGVDNSASTFNRASLPALCLPLTPSFRLENSLNRARGRARRFVVRTNNEPKDVMSQSFLSSHLTGYTSLPGKVTK
ncbi:hypothetical protein D3C77_362490 [compost metagenome]